MILDIITDIVIGGMAGAGGVIAVNSSIYSKYKKPKYRLNKDGSMPWSFVIENNSNSGIRCLKCSKVNGDFDFRFNHPKLCHCLEYFQDHFHFKCNNCDYSNILQTADHE